MTPTVCLTDVAEFVRDGTHGSPIRTEVGIPVLSAMNVKDGVLNFATDRFTSSAEYLAFSKRLPLTTGDVLLTIVGTIGRSAVVDQVVPLVFQRSVAVIRPRRTLMDSRFLYHVTKSSDFQNQLDRASNKSSQAGVYLGKLGAITVPQLALSEQRRIAAILDQADALRAKRREALAQLDSLTQSIFIEMFGEPESNIKNWEKAQLGDICDLFNGYAFKSSDYVESSQTLNCRMSNIRPNGEFDIDYHPKFLPDSFAKEYERFVLHDNDVIIAMTDLATEARILGVPTTVVTKGKTLLLNQRVGKLQIPPIGRVIFPYLRQMLAQKYVKRYFQKFAGGGLQINLSKSDLLSVQVYLPPLSLQKKFAEKVEAVAPLRVHHVKAIREVDSLFASLQNRAFRGHL